MANKIFVKSVDQNKQNGQTFGEKVKLTKIIN